MNLLIAVAVLTCPIWLPICLGATMERRPGVDDRMMRFARFCRLPIDD